MNDSVGVYAARPRSRSRFNRLVKLLRCPLSHQPLKYNADRNILLTADGSVSWPVNDFVPNLFQGIDTRVVDQKHLSNTLSSEAEEFILSQQAPVLNLSAGGTDRWQANTIELETAIFRNTDIVGDAHNLPFLDNSFGAVIAMNSFEHYHSPHLVANEIRRILRPGGQVFLHAAFLQPLHEEPYHFFNTTEFGFRNLFDQFESVEVSVPYNFNFLFGLSWMLSELDFRMRQAGETSAADQIGTLTVDKLMQFWRNPDVRNDPLWQNFFDMDDSIKRRLAAGFQVKARKRSL